MLPPMASMSINAQRPRSELRSAPEAGMTTERIIGDLALVAAMSFVLAIIAGVFG
jgi:hypothetical protein